jgi:nitroreductase
VDFFDVVTTTRAIRRYRPDPIPEDDLAQIFFAATRAPSGSNSQPFRFLVLRDGPKATEARRILGESFRTMWATKRSADGYDQGSGLDLSSPKGRMAGSMQHFVDHIDQAPVIVLACVCHRHNAHFTEGASVYPACQNLLLAARALGYGGVITMWHQAVASQLTDLLAIPDEASIAATIPLGRPVGNHGPVRRRPLADLISEDTWTTPAPRAIDPQGTRHTGRPRS